MDDAAAFVGAARQHVTGELLVRVRLDTGGGLIPLRQTPINDVPFAM